MRPLATWRKACECREQAITGRRIAARYYPMPTCLGCDTPWTRYEFGAASGARPGPIYLACPYSSDRDPRLPHERFIAANYAAAKLMQQGAHVFSPISHGHPIAKAGALPTCWAYWESYCRTMLTACSRVIVLMLDGWQESTGIAGEIAIARELGLPVEYLDPGACEREASPVPAQPELPL